MRANEGRTHRPCALRTQVKVVPAFTVSCAMRWEFSVSSFSDRTPNLLGFMAPDGTEPGSVRSAAHQGVCTALNFV